MFEIRQVPEGLLRIIDVGVAIVIIVIMVVWDIGRVLGNMLRHQFQPVAWSTAHQMREITLRGNQRLPREQQHQEYE